MQTYDTSLLERLEAWSPDDADSEFTFSQRLARENDWSREFTGRVIREYKRFLLLAVAAGHPVSPSDTVDQAWHLHLLYTRSYWSELCPNILGTPLHHGPTRGGEAEREKFHDWYLKTLVSYCRFFKQSPPVDIWPRPGVNNDEADFARVNLAQKWVIPKPQWWRDLSREFQLLWRILKAIGSKAVPRNAFPCFVACVGLVTLSGCSIEDLDVFDWRAEPFLNFFVVLWAVTAGIAGFLRYKATRVETGKIAPDPELDPYELAFLSGGLNRSIFTAVANLSSRGAVVIAEKDGKIVPTFPPADALAFEAMVYRQIYEKGTKFRDLYWKCSSQPEAKGIESRLRSLGLFTSTSQQAKQALVPTLIALIAPAVGIIKVTIGISRDRPVEYLVILSLVSLVCALCFANCPLRTRRGDDVLEKMRDKNGDLEFAGHVADLSLGSESLPMALALFGPAILQQTEFADLEKKLQTDVSTSTSGCGGSGCGAGCGGGGGCGGGCGGGGCGGCGA